VRRHTCSVCGVTLAGLKGIIIVEPKVYMSQLHTRAATSLLQAPTRYLPSAGEHHALLSHVIAHHSSVKRANPIMPSKFGWSCHPTG
jgi:hypothetical protein